MNQRIAGRLARLEQHSRPAYASNIGRPLREWPDAMLTALICEELGMGLRHLSNEHLDALLREYDHAAALE